MLGGVYIQLCIPSKIILRVFTEFVLVLRWNSMLRGVYFWLCVFLKIILWILAEFASILSRSSMMRGVYVWLCVHSKIVWQVLTSLFWDLRYTDVVTCCTMMVVIRVDICHVLNIISSCDSCVFICAIL